MRNLLLAAVCVAWSFSAQAELMITGVFDGPLSGGLPKGVELYAIDDVADLSRYGIASANNGGGTSASAEYSFPPDSLAAGGYLYVASEAEGFMEFFGFPPDYVASSAMSINGDDAIELFLDGAVVDRFGDPDVDGTGTPWEYTDGWAYRADGGVRSPQFDHQAWEFSGRDGLDNAATNSAADQPVPIGTFLSDGGQPPEPPSLVTISAVQGSPATYGSNEFGETDVSPLIGQQVTVEAVVVGDFQDGDDDEGRNLNGFYLQEEVSDEDGNDASSEGVFVYAQGVTVDVELGDLVRVTGVVDQYFGETQIAQVVSVDILARQQLAQVAPAILDLLGNNAVSVSQNGSYQPDLEAFEGMWVRIDQPLTVSEQFQLDRFNEIRLIAGERAVQFTQQNAPNAVLYDQHLRAVGARTISYDDGLNIQNAPVGGLEGLADYTEETAIRMGDRIEGLAGVLDYKWAGASASGATWRVRANGVAVNRFTSTATGDSPNPRPESAPSVAGNLTVSSFNVLNWFTTLDQGSALTAVGLEPRGADSPEELERQLSKLVNAIVAMDADLFGLVEIENDFDPVNDGSTAVETLVNAVNTRLGESVYDYVDPGRRFVGGDAIAVAMIYKTESLEIAAGTQPAVLDDAAAAELAVYAGRDFAADPIFDGPATNRASLAAHFTHRASGEQFVVVANHFKSKGSSDLENSENPNYDQLDGAGFWNARRLEAAVAVEQWLASNPTGVPVSRSIVLGDLNAYAAEDPVQYLLAHGFNNVEREEAYSYVFDGQVGTLDYLLVNDAMADDLVASAVWHINADEADALDYNLDFGREAFYFNGLTATRNSDHDPVIAGFELAVEPITPDQLNAAFVDAYQRGALLGIGRFSLVQTARALLYYGTLESAALWVRRGKIAHACRAYEHLRVRSDGDIHPRDWIEGSDLPDFLAKLSALTQELGCEP